MSDPRRKPVRKSDNTDKPSDGFVDPIIANVKPSEKPSVKRVKPSEGFVDPIIADEKPEN